MVVLSPSKLKSVQNIPWRVGRGAVKQEVSKGMVIRATLPHLGVAILTQLYKDYGVDSWLVKIERTNIKWGRQVIGYFIIPIKGQVHRRLRIIAGTTFRLQVNYAAASVSDRFNKFICPSFGHRLKLSKVELQDENFVRRHFSIRRMTPLMGQAEKVGFISPEFNGGSSLQGDYRISLALYSIDKRYLMSEYIPVSGKVSVQIEDPVEVEGCDNFVIPPKKRNKSKGKLFPFFDFE